MPTRYLMMKNQSLIATGVNNVIEGEGFASVGSAE